MSPSDYLPEAAFSDAAWQKGRASDPNQNCVEFAKVGETIGVRDSKNPGGPILQFTEAEIAAMLSGAKDGEFDHLA